MRNIVLVSLDSVRKDTFDEMAPRLAARASRSFPQARAASSWTVPSHASMLTGELPHRHGVHTYDRDYGGLDRADTFLADLPDHRLLGASANVFAGEPFAFDRLFDEFRTVSNVQTFPDGLDLGDFVSDSRYDHPLAAFLWASLRNPNRLQSLANGALTGLDHLATGRPVPNLVDNGGHAVDRAARSLVDGSDEPFFLFCNFMEAHTPIEPYRWLDGDRHDVPASYTTSELSVWDLMESIEDHPEYVAHWRQLYGAAVDYLDRRVAGLVDRLAAATDRETTVVVTADHGENLGYAHEDRLVRHKSSLSEGLLHVPLLVINPPPGAQSGTEPGLEDRYVSHLDLGEFLVDLAHGEPSDPTRDRAAAELMGMSAGPEPPARREYWDRAMRCVYEGARKVWWDSLGDAVAYELDTDRPCWQRVVDEEAAVPAWADEYFETDLEAADRAAREAATEGDEVSEVTGARLEALGYR